MDKPQCHQDSLHVRDKADDLNDTQAKQMQVSFFFIINGDRKQ